MQWDRTEHAGFSTASNGSLYSPIIRGIPYGAHQVNAEDQQRDPGSLWNTIRKMIAARKQHLAFGRGDFKWLELDNDHIAPFRRTYGGETIFAIHNLSESPETISLSHLGDGPFTDVLSRQQLNAQETLELSPSQYIWLSQVSQNR
jgi:glycosidase